MTNKELQLYLAKYPDDMPLRWRCETTTESGHYEMEDFDEDKILHTSETAYVDIDAPEDEWDTEVGKIELGSGQQYLLFNPLIV